MSQKITILENSTFSAGKAKSFTDNDAAAQYIIARVEALVEPRLRERMAHALRERIVSEDGNKATSEVLAGKLTFAKALAMAFAPQVSVITNTYKDDLEDDK